MTEVHVSPNNGDSGVGLLAIIILLVVLVILSLFAYTSGWFSMNQEDPSETINITIPTPEPSTEQNSDTISE